MGQREEERLRSRGGCAGGELESHGGGDGGGRGTNEIVDNVRVIGPVRDPREVVRWRDERSTRAGEGVTHASKGRRWGGRPRVEVWSALMVTSNETAPAERRRSLAFQDQLSPSRRA